MTINEAVDFIIKGVKDEWSALEKIRYVYLELGKILYKNTDFFFSVDNKLGDKNLTIEEIEKIYDDKKDSGDLKVICRSAAYILQKVYDILGIKSELIKSNNNIINYEDEDKDKSLEINHWFLATYDEDGKAYFLTLASDLPYIQMGMQTRHFATNIPYTKTQKNGNVIQVYCGDEIKHTVLKDEQLRKIDVNIGYLKNYYNYDENYRLSNNVSLNYTDAAIAMLANELKGNKLYYDIEIQNTRFYKKLMEFRSADKELSLYGKKLDSLRKEDWDAWVKRLCKLVHKKIEQMIEYKIYIKTYYNEENWNYKDWLNDICVQLQRHLFRILKNDHPELYITGDFNYSKWSRSMKKVIQSETGIYDIDNILLMLDKTNILVSSIELGQPTEKFMKVFTLLAYHFLNRNYVLESDVNGKKVTNKYISHKFSVLFKKIFSCNEGTTEFNKMNYSEQTVIIKLMLEKMFPELNVANAIIGDNYDEQYTVIQNRIQVYAVKNKTSDEYAFIFHIVGDKSNKDFYDDAFDDCYYFYNPKENVFKVTNILNIGNDYNIISNRLKTRIEDMENIEYEDKRWKK